MHHYHIKCNSIFTKIFFIETFLKISSFGFEVGELWWVVAIKILKNETKLILNSCYFYKKVH
jgi:hypothetical protein